MTFNEFTRRLENCHLDEDTKFILSHMFEVQTEFSKQLDQAMGVMLGLPETMQNLTNLHEHTVEGVRRILRRGVDGVEVHSVRNDPDDRD